MKIALSQLFPLQIHTLPGMKWVDNHKGVFSVNIQGVSTIHTQVTIIRENPPQFENRIMVRVCLFCCNHTCYCVNMVSVTSASRYLTSATRYHPRYQSRSSMYIRGLIPQNFLELAKAVLIEVTILSPYDQGHR